MTLWTLCEWSDMWLPGVADSYEPLWWWEHTHYRSSRGIDDKIDTLYTVYNKGNWGTKITGLSRWACSHGFAYMVTQWPSTEMWDV